MPMRRHIKLVLPLAIALTLLLTMPLPVVLHRGFVFSAQRPESRDYLLNTWILAWGAHAVTTPGETLFDANAFYPRRNTLAYSDHLLGNLPLTIPLRWAGANLVLVHNLLLLLSFALSFVGMYALGWQLTGSRGGAVFGALAYAFCGYRFSNIERLQLLSSQWMPFAMLFVHRFLDRRRPADLAWAGAFAFAQAMVSCYYALLFPVFVLLWAVVKLALDWRADRRAQRTDARRRFLGAWAGLGALAVAYAIACMPFFWPYVELKREFGFRRDVGENVSHSADIVNYLTAPDTNVLYGKCLRRWAGDGNELFPGFIVLALAAVGLARRRRDAAACAYGLAGGACALLALGPVVRLAGHELGPGPYALLYRFVPGFEGLRNPSRFGMLTMLSLAALSAWGYAELLRWLESARASRSGRATWAAAVLVCAGVEQCCAPLGCRTQFVGSGIPEEYRWLAQRPDLRVVLEVPFDLDVADREYLYYSTYHWKRLVNGVSGWSPPEDVAKYFTLSRLADPETVQLLSDMGVDCVLAHAGLGAALGPGYRVLRKFGSTVAAAPLAPRRGLARPMPPVSSCDRRRWRVAARPHSPAARLAVDGRLDTAWRTVRAQRGGDSFAVDFGETVTVSAVHVWLGEWTDELPVACAVECAAALDAPFRRVLERVSCASYYRTSLIDPRRARLIIRLPPTRCRALRLVQCEQRPRYLVRSWAIAEIAAFGGDDGLSAAARPATPRTPARRSRPAPPRAAAPPRRR